MNNIKEVSSQTFDICNKRNVEAAIVETATRTELSVEYSVPSVNMNVQTEDLDYGALTFRSRSRSLDRQQISRVLQKLFLARRILNPVVDEIINAASLISERDLQKATNAPICSISKQEYRGALRASQIFCEVNEELLQKYRREPLVVGENFHFPMSKTIVNMVTMSNRSQKDSVLEIADRIYIDKDLMLQMIELYELLGETIKKLREKEKEQRSASAFEPLATSSRPTIQDDRSITSSKAVTSQRESFHSFRDSRDTEESTFQSLKCQSPTRQDESSFQSAKSQSFQDEASYQSARSQSKQESFQSARSKGSDTSRRSKVSQANVSRKSEQPAGPSCTRCRKETSNTFGSVEEAQAQAKKCLETLANVQQYIEKCKGGEIDLTNKLILTDTLEKNNCGKQSIPHMHALLNGVPVILMSMQGNKNAPEVILVSSSTDLIIQSSKANLESSSPKKTREKLAQGPLARADSNREFCRERETKESPRHSRSLSSKSPSELGINNVTGCPCHRNREKSCPCMDRRKRESWQRSLSTVKSESISLTEGSNRSSDSTVVTEKSATVCVQPQEKITIVGDSISSVYLPPSHTGSANTLNINFSISVVEEPEQTKPSQISVTNKGQKSVLATIHHENSVSNTDARVPYLPSAASMPKKKASLKKSIHSYKIEDLRHLAKPAKCCRKSYLNEPLQPGIPYPPSLTSLHLDDDDIDAIDKNIHAKGLSNKVDQAASCNCHESVEVLFVEMENEKDNSFTLVPRHVHPWSSQAYKIMLLEPPEKSDTSHRKRSSKSVAIQSINKRKKSNPKTLDPANESVQSVAPAQVSSENTDVSSESAEIYIPSAGSLPLIENKSEKDVHIAESKQTKPVNAELQCVKPEVQSEKEKQEKPPKQEHQVITAKVETKHVGSSCESLVACHMCVKTDVGVQCEPVEEVSAITEEEYDAIFDTVMRDMDGIPSVLYDEDGNMYVIDVVPCETDGETYEEVVKTEISHHAQTVTVYDSPGSSEPCNWGSQCSCCRKEGDCCDSNIYDQDECSYGSSGRKNYPQVHYVTQMPVDSTVNCTRSEILEDVKIVLSSVKGSKQSVACNTSFERDLSGIVFTSILEGFCDDLLEFSENLDNMPVENDYSILSTLILDDVHCL